MCLGIPGQIVELIDADRQLALVSVAGVRRRIDISCVIDDTHPFESSVGAWVLVHVGFAMSRISGGEAAEQLRLLKMLGEDAQAMAELDGYEFGSP